MWEIIRKNPLAFFFALTLHLILIVFLLVRVDWSKPGSQSLSPPPVIDAQLVDQTEPFPTEAVKRKPASPEIEDETAEVAAEQEALAEAKQQEALEAQQKAEEEARRQAELEAQREAEEEARRQAELEAQRKAEEEARRQAELERQRREAEAKRLAEEEAKRKIEEQRRREAEAALQERLAEEERQRQVQQAAQEERTVQRYVSYIKDKVERNWLRPAGSGKDRSCTVRVRVMPGGAVLSADVIKSSGNAAFDRSVETAVLKASPLPIPDDPDLQKRFREIRFEFVPKD